jgi:tetratricopeptide (TPR) repeat protein
MQYFEEDSGLAFRPHLLLGSAYMATARWQEALRHIQRASEIVKASGRSARSCMVSVFYAGTLLELGHVDEAVALLYETEALCKEDGFLVARADCLLYLGAAFAIRQDWVQARVMAIRAGDLAHEASYPALQSEAEALLADCAMADRLIQEALVHAQRSGELARATGRDRTLTLSLHRLGRALIAGGDRNGGIAAYVEGLSVGPVALLESKLPSAVDALLFLRQRPGYEAQAARLLAGVAAGSEASYAVREHMRRAGVEPLAGSKIPSGQAVVRETLALLQAIN